MKLIQSLSFPFLPISLDHSLFLLLWLHSVYIVDFLVDSNWPSIEWNLKVKRKFFFTLVVIQLPLVLYYLLTSHHIFFLSLSILIRSLDWCGNSSRVLWHFVCSNTKNSRLELNKSAFDVISFEFEARFEDIFVLYF